MAWAIGLAGVIETTSEKVAVVGEKMDGREAIFGDSGSKGASTGDL